MELKYNLFFKLIFNSFILSCFLFRGAVNANQNMPLDLKLNQIQILGSHNSYKRAIPPSVFDFIKSENSQLAQALNYSHPDLETQLNMGLRQLEIDILKDDIGGYFLNPLGENIAQKPLLTEQENKALAQPGFKVMHKPDIDFMSHCVLFTDCLKQLNLWSAQNSNHLPIFVLMNIKESENRIVKGQKPQRFTPQDFRKLDQLLVNSFKNKLYTPDKLKREYASLPEAVKHQGWPSLNEMRGKFIFLLDASAEQLTRYRGNNKNLSGLSLFASFEEDDPGAAIFVVNNPIAQFDKIQRLVDLGFIVRTRSDANTSDAMNQNYKRVNAAILSGAQIISTDYYLNSPQSERDNFKVSFESDKWINFPQQ
ncbi:Ca2+-dependent phosphoinositide-specific phospholipase C [Catenovulum adriaticum]|uniref:Phosphatidylinositol-specific phospholipase C1-like protein n=1 Tax=Catenovulum adriaticum TaxID=2984846 RepID=A0ABY7ARK4_9ALTE|nr:Ca2+-dependent phosphoinositide-specific phospholipase C [Catenovulum sp. TS8]WAJ72168.1 phosphatidylinositol-specific phospholipase C1-like protein [Catenovulum sp. TS8]